MIQNQQISDKAKFRQKCNENQIYNRNQRIFS